LSFSDTLHRFWKKEHDWGWKKYMELSKVDDGFVDDFDNLIIKAQVQVIRYSILKFILFKTPKFGMPSIAWLFDQMG